jgi:ribosomal protein L11 methyltransferase
MARSWLLLQVTVPVGQVERFQTLLTELGTLGVEERPADGEAWRVHQPWEQAPNAHHRPDRVELLAYFERSDDEAARTARVEHAASFVPGAEVAVGTMAEGDWEERWRSTFVPLEVAPGVVIAPPWEPRPGALIIEPGAAFGTGQHPTTLACLQAVARHAQPGQSLLDVGCGTGVLAILGASLGMTATGVDCDPAAVQASWDNARRNDLPCSFGTRSARVLTGRYDLVVANIYAEELVRLASDLRRLTGRRLVLAGILADRAHTVVRAMSPLAPSRRSQAGEWVSLEYTRP